VDKETEKKIEAKVEELKNSLQGWSYIVFLIDRKADVDGGLHGNVNLGDALVCIERIAEQFQIDPEALYQTLAGLQKEG